MPCLNEAKSLEYCITEAKRIVSLSRIDAEILIADNGSTDGSVEIAQKLGARVIHVDNKGYGAALRGGISAARGNIIVVADADGSYDFSEVPKFIYAIEVLKADLVIGNRFRGGIERNAMPILHRYLGNPVLSFLGRLFYRTEIRDFHCGMRAIRKSSFSKLSLSSYGMEFASEIIVRALMAGQKVVEIPTKLRKDLRGRKSHLNTWRDGWAHLIFLMVLSPNWVLMIPGLVMFSLGTFLTAILLIGPIDFYSITLDTQALIYSCSFVITGMLCLNIWKIANLSREKIGFGRRDKFVELIVSKFIERWNGAVSIVGTLCSLALMLFSIWYWKENSFGDLDSQIALRLAVSSSLFLALSLQSFFFKVFWAFINSLNRENLINWREDL